MNHSLPILWAIALGIILMILAPSAYAADRAHSNGNLRLASLNARLSTPKLTNLCMNLGSSPECEAAFARALQSTDDDAESVVVTATGTGYMKGPHGIKPLRFQKHAPWVRSLDKLSKEGIAFFRVPRGPQNELVVGINRKGMLGFQLRKISN